MAYRGAGGTEGGSGTFLIGIAMMILGGYLLLNNIVVRPVLGFGMVAFRLGGMPITTGIILIPFIFGVALIFYNSRNWLGWLLACGSLLALVGGVIANMTLQFGAISAFDLIVILVLVAGGLGLFLRSLRAR